MPSARVVAPPAAGRIAGPEVPHRVAVRPNDGSRQGPLAAATVPPCQRPDADPEAWFPLVKTGPITPNVARAEQLHARVLCAGCPRTAACLEEAMTSSVGRYGIWGGTSERERARMRDRAARARRRVAVTASDEAVA